MTTGRWKEYWDHHARAVSSDEPYRRVQRVCQKREMGDAQFQHAASYVVSQLDLELNHVVLDLCCGNGLLSDALEPWCQKIVGVDFCKPLLKDLVCRTAGKTVAVAANALKVSFTASAFDRVLIAAALQYFELGETIRLFRNAATFLKPGGILLVTEVPDSARMWCFFDDAEREDAYFRNRENDTPILGTWFDRTWLVNLARHAGFRSAVASDQPSDFLYSHYRFDLRCAK